MAKAVIGKKNTVKVGKKSQVEENKQPLEQEEEKVETKATSRRTTATRQSTVNERPATKRRLKGGRASGRDPFWYLKHEGELEMVTAEGHNEVLGIKEIQVWDPSESQWQNGVLANVTLVMEYITIKGIQVRESIRDASGAVYMQTQSRSWDGQDGKRQYMNDVEVARPVQAQILSFVENMLESAE